MSTETFLKLVDGWQSTAYRSLLDAYHDDVYSKLLAFKAANLVVRRFELQRRKRVLLMRPPQLMVDPANACQLACPGCLHGDKWAAVASWPKNTLAIDRFDEFMSRFGPTACATMLYNFGEPLLNKRFPSFVKLARSYQSFVAASTNLSLPIDADAIASSGLDLLILSIDGTTQESYERYRINGRLDLVLDNVRALVAARARLGSERPYLSWQFLTFEHNQHQLDEVFTIARSLGVDAVKVMTPSDWGWDGDSWWRNAAAGLGLPVVKRGLRPVKSTFEGEHRFRPYAAEVDVPTWRSSMLTDDVATHIEAAYATSWIERFRRDGKEEDDRGGSGTCAWLYDNITMDGATRLLPCCLMPVPEWGQMVYGRFAPEADTTAADVVNTNLAVLSRTAFADRGEYKRQTKALAADERPYCASCRQQPLVPFAWPFPQWRVELMDRHRALAHLGFERLTSVGDSR